MKRLIVLASVVLFCSCRPLPYQLAQEKVPVGTPRDEAIAILSEEAWYHQECNYDVVIDDLFFYGSHKYDKADVVILCTEPIDGVFVVYGIYTFEPNAWHAAYRDCLQRDKFED